MGTHMIDPRSKPDLLTDGSVIVVPEVSPETVIVQHDDGSQWVIYDGVEICALGRKKALPNEYVHPEPGYPVGRCKMIKANGNRCKLSVRPTLTVCRSHGAGSAMNPGGRPLVTGRYLRYLPARMLDRYKEFMMDTDIINLRSEMALLDTRIVEQLEKLETSDSKTAWLKIHNAKAAINRILSGKECDSEDLESISDILSQAMAMRDTETEVWSSVLMCIDQRRKLADTERRRIEASHKYLTLDEAEAMMAFITEVVIKYIPDGVARRQISEQLRVFASRFGAQGVPTMMAAASRNLDEDDPDPEDVEDPDIIDMEL